MSNIIEVTLPDIGDFDAVEVIEVLVEAGQSVETEQSIVTLESDKASMEIPTPSAGVVKSVHIALGDSITQGSLLIKLEAQNDETSPAPEVVTEQAQTTQTIVVPDIGDIDEVEVIEVLVSVGDELGQEDSIITLESDKASMEIPTPTAGTVDKVLVAVGDKVKLGDDILTLTTVATATQVSDKPAETITPEPKQAPSTAAKNTVVGVTPQAEFHASPAMRKLARELGVDLAIVAGTGASGRIIESDIKAFVKQVMQNGGSTSGSALPKMPSADYAKFGEIETLPLSRINKLSGKHLHACWLNIPHVTQFDEVDISNLEDFRQSQKAKGIKLTPLVFIMKAVATALANNPNFNASLSEDNQALITKKYINLGIAVDTPNGLIVPVIRDVPSKSITQLMADLMDVSSRARDGKLTSTDLQGGTFTISSLGGIGGTQFTPIVNAPEVAILGVSRSSMKPIWNGKEFVPQLMLPLALSYDHRVIDGARGAKFITELNGLLTDIRGLL